MGIKEKLKEWVEKRNELKERLREAKIEKAVQERQLSSEERELNGYRDRERQERIKRLVEQKRKGATKQMFDGKSTNPAYAKNVMVGHKKLFGSSNNLFANQRNLFTGGANLFVNQKNIFKREENMAKGKPKRDGSGRGVRANRGRGGCVITKPTGQGRMR